MHFNKGPKNVHTCHYVSRVQASFLALCFWSLGSFVQVTVLFSTFDQSEERHEPAKISLAGQHNWKKSQIK